MAKEVTGAEVSRPHPPINVLIVEDSAIVRHRLRAMIAERVPQVTAIHGAATGERARQCFAEHRPAAVVLDLQLPGASGLELLPEFKRQRPDCVIIVLTSHSAAAIRDRCLDLGADYFFDKSSQFEHVLDALARVAE